MIWIVLHSLVRTLTYLTIPVALCDHCGQLQPRCPSPGAQTMEDFLKLIELDFDPSNPDYKSLALSPATGCVPVAALSSSVSEQDTEAAVTGELLILPHSFPHTSCPPGWATLNTPLTVAVVCLPAESPRCAAVPCGLSPVPAGQGGHEPL